MQHKPTALNGDFGLMIDGVTRVDLEDAVFQREASQQNNQDRRRAHAPASADTRSQRLLRASLRLPR